MTAKSFGRAVLAGAMAGTALLGLAGSASASDTAGYIGDGYANNSRAVWCVQHLINDVARNNNRATIDEDSIWGLIPKLASIPFSYQAATGSTYCYDLHATILHLLGIDHKRLTFRHNGIDRRLTDVHGKVIRELLA